MKPPHLPLWTAPFPLFLTSLLTPVATQGIQGFPHILYSSLELPDMLGRAHFAKKWHAGHLHALEHATVRSRTVDAPCQPPPATSGLPSAPDDAPRRPQHAKPWSPSSFSLLRPPSHARHGRPRAPMSTLTRAAPLAPPAPSLPSPGRGPPPQTPHTRPSAPPWPPATARSSPVHEPRCTVPLLFKATPDPVLSIP